MEKRLSYIVVGAFVIGIAISLLLFLFWITKYGDKGVENDYYLTYFKESVSGLNIEASVKLRGVEVGRVKKIAINKDNSEEVEVLLELIKGTPVKIDSFTTLDSQGITGLKYIELKGGAKNAALLATSKDNIALIPSKKSTMSQLFDSSESISLKLENILDRVAYLLNEENINNTSKTLKEFSSIAEYFNANKHQVFDLLTQADIFFEHTKKFEDDMMPSVQKLGVMSDKAGAAADKTSVFFDKMSRELENGEFNIASIVEQNLQTLNEAATSLRDLSITLENTIEELGESPSDLLYKSKTEIPGPGEGNE